MQLLSHRALSGAVVLAVILGCAVSKVRLGSAQGLVKDLEPESNPGEHAVLNYNGPTVPVSVEHHVDAAGKETLTMSAFGEAYEQEIYERKPKSFAVITADGDTFDPPLPLLTDDPVAPWSGTVTSGKISHTAKATVVVSEDTVKTNKVTLTATRSVAKLEIDGGGKTPAVRTLSFWIVKGRGVVKTEFSMGIKRLSSD